MKRRDLIMASAATAAATTLGNAASAQPSAPGAPTGAPGTGAQGGMQYRALGRTGERVSMVGVGGFHLGAPSEDEAIRIVRTALDNGINFLDNSWDYNNGVSEERMGKALADGYRSKAFLMTKIDGRTAQSATQQLDESLRRLRTDHLDLLQFHEIIRMEDPDRIFAQGGALEAVLRAKEAGKLRYIGFTGHKSPDIHKKMLDVAARHKFHFDTVQMPLNVMDAHFHSFERAVLPILVREEIGVLGMKSMGDKTILRSNTVTPIECLRYTMSLPTSVTITGMDSVAILQQALTVARTFKPLSAQERQALLAKTVTAAKNGQFELYKTSQNNDSTTTHPQWLG
ncbi:MAG TPA: aldo/keto reductase [Alphaproteobacteria bacterium]